MRFGAPCKTSLVLSLLMLTAASAAGAAELEDSQVVGLFNDERAAVATSPIPRPISKIAENVTVITADDIARLNAHTLADVLQTVPGIQLDFTGRTPTSFTFFNIQGALNTTVLVLVDGIRQNDFDQDQVSPGAIPVQQIERVEIVKGAASGSWGSALGGVVNVVTKSPDPDREVSGLVSGSVGSRFTSDSRAELSGSKGDVGYYLTGGHFGSDGLTPDTDTSADNLYGKITYALPGSGSVGVALSHFGAWPGEGAGTVPRLGFLSQDGQHRHNYALLRYDQPLAHSLNFKIFGYATDSDDSIKTSSRNSSGARIDIGNVANNTETRGVNAALSFGDSRRNLVAGAEYLHGHGRSRDLFSLAPPVYDRTWDGYALYLNGAYSIGEFSVLPGVRFDSTGFSGDHPSYTLGLTYQLPRETTLRVYGADGFSLPMLANDTGTQKVHTVQAGMETGAVPYLWLKGTYFFNRLDRAQSAGPVQNATVTDQDREGFELEARTVTYLGVSFGGGYTYLYARDRATGKRLQTNGQQTVPPQVYKLALYYDGPDLGLRGELAGSGVVWNATPGFPARSAGMVWDLHLSWKPSGPRSVTPELFFSAHNLFDAVQTTLTWVAPNPSRWYEGGIRLWF